MIGDLVAWIAEEEDHLDDDIKDAGKGLSSYYSGVIQPLVAGADRGDIPEYLEAWRKANETAHKKCSETFERLWSAARNLEDYAQQSAHENDVEQARDEFDGDPEDFDPDMIETTWETVREYAESEKDSIDSDEDYDAIIQSVGGKTWFWKDIENKGSDWSDEIGAMHKAVTEWIARIKAILAMNKRYLVAVAFDVEMEDGRLETP